MVVADGEALVDALRDVAGDGLRVVATYDGDGYETVYVRGDVSLRVAERADDVHDELVLQGIGRGHLEELFGAGDLQCSMHRFEELAAFHFPAAEHTGLFVSVDSEADVSLATFAETCKRYMDGDGPSP
ncbi:MAG: hypothetical protein V5A44_13270 [Haloarculaceae archaeon]